MKILLKPDLLQRAVLINGVDPRTVFHDLESIVLKITHKNVLSASRVDRELGQQLKDGVSLQALQVAGSEAVRMGLFIEK